MTGLDIIKKFEGLRLSAYTCPAGKLTIGYGHTKGVYDGQTITEAEAQKLLEEDYFEAQVAVKQLVTVSLSENQTGALSSFVFNLGKANLAKSTLLKKINIGDFDGAAKEFDKWVFAAGVKLKGLIARRAAERKLFEEK